MDAAKLVKAYVAIRDALAEGKKEWEDREKQLKEQQASIESALIGLCESTGATSLKTDYGTATRKVQSRIWTQNWEAMHDLCLKENNLDLLERRISQKAMEEFMENNPDKKPDGICVDRKYVINVRRAS